MVVTTLLYVQTKSPAIGCVAASSCCVNLWCLYLQFAFAATSYQRCCGWCDIRCRDCGRNRMKTLIYRNSNDLASKSANKQYANVEIEESVSRSSCLSNAE